MAKGKEESFEELMSNLEEITDKLEVDKLSLDEAVALFEQGMKISKDCNKKLEDAEKRITILLNSDGEIKEENFTPEG